MVVTGATVPDNEPMSSPSHPGRGSEDRASSAPTLSSTLPLTSRTVVLVVAAAVITVVLGLLAVGLTGGSSDSGASAGATAATPSAEGRASASALLSAAPSRTAGADATSSARASSSPEPTATASSSATAGAHPTPTSSYSVDSEGIIHTDVTGHEQWTVAEPVEQPEGLPQAVYSYLLEAEDGSGVDVDAIAPTINEILNDERGWRSIDNVSFKQVSDPSQAGFTIKVATPGTVDRLCAPLETEGTWDCQISADVVLNADRWSYGVPWFRSLDDYRGYLVNHEVGHFLGRDHEQCGGKGLKAPVMMQQSKGLGGCVANPWPTQDSQPD